MARTAVVDALSRIDLYDPDQPDGIRARVEEASGLIHEDVEAAYTGRLADIVPITTTNTTRSAAA